MPRHATTLVRRAPRAPRAGYALEIAKWPSVWGVVVLGVSAGLVINAALLVPFAVMLASATWIAAGNPEVQHKLVADTRDHALRKRREDRETKLEEAHVACSGLNHATTLVDVIVRDDPRGAARDDLEALLDHYAEVAIVHARCTAITQAAERPPPDTTASPRPLVVRKRRLEMHIRERARALEHELAALIELLHYLAERDASLGPDVDDHPASASAINDAVGERLARLDADD